MGALDFPHHENDEHRGRLEPGAQISDHIERRWRCVLHPIEHEANRLLVRDRIDQRCNPLEEPETSALCIDWRRIRKIEIVPKLGQDSRGFGQQMPPCAREESRAWLS